MTRRLSPLRLALAGAGLLAPLALLDAGARAADPTIPTRPPALSLPPLPGPDAGLPPLPERAARNANYTIEARLDPEQHTIEGSLILEWRNTSESAVDAFPFHLYWNAFRNNLSTSARGAGRRAARNGDRDGSRGWGYTHVRSVRLLGDAEHDLTPSLRYLHPDDDNADDRSVMEVRTPKPVAPGETARFAIAWTSRVPHGDVGRAGWVHDYHFVAQWFPKIGVLQKDGWNAHQFHAMGEFFSDFGVYDVKLTLPADFVVGATGVQTEAEANSDGTRTLRFRQDDVHDFAWTASRRFLERKGRFEDAGYPPVEMRLLLQPEHAALAERYLEATRIALRSYGAWSAPYPYPQITVVDPAWRSASGGMEYPTLFTGGANVWAPPALQSPEGVTIHEAGHQFWYGLVANNEFEEAWLDEGFNSYHDEKASVVALGLRGYARRYFGVSTPGRGSRGGFPVVAPGVWIGRGEGDLAALRRTGEVDRMARRAWEYRLPEAYSLNSYGKPALSLQTLEGLLGDETMTRVLRSYARRFRFAHPTSEDFIRTVNEVTGQDWRWFFDETWFSSQLCDYAVEVRQERPRQVEGFVDGPGAGLPVLAPAAKPTQAGWESSVSLLRLGGVRLPVDLLVEFDDGRRVLEHWDGKDRWTRFRYAGPARVVRALVDPEGKLALDVDPSNNSWVQERGRARRAASKWAARWMFWLQNLLELQTVLG